MGFNDFYVANIWYLLLTENFNMVALYWYINMAINDKIY
jgi:hypothetical protein